ncbi:FAD dependent oxidoreductase [Laetiporus sulphureus 93-53]|uniref:FAD dependent oxidoreductase n=1 Tax=Laetiporus sulphureus 93-53 TaxID=1314785 RepID=A0A165F0P6_9APHY|nr:FAD dependent oxidoreductase [Laetiporus sulphureus 93-53]KZT08118.1 FAD dependent oxidoreductase [Laetiporus sulphureus 93-53]
MSDDASEKNIVIIGGGIIGCTAAYYICSHPLFASSGAKITLIEASASGVAKGASGKAGGLVAKWAYPKELVSISFPEHVRLAKEHNGAERWGFRFVGCGSWEGRGESLKDGTGSGVGKGGERRNLEKTNGLDAGWNRRKLAETGFPEDLNWIKPELTQSYTPMAPPGATAQVHPYQFTTSMLQLAQEKGLRFITGKVNSIRIDHSQGRVSSVTYVETGVGARPGSHTIPATHVVLAAGAWAPKLLPSLPIVGTRAHSITIIPKSGVKIAPYVLFTEIQLPLTGRTRVPQHVSPEIYPRPDNEVYCCGPGDNSRLPDTVDEVQVDQAACESVRQHVSSISKELREGIVDRRQACFLPVVSSGGGPIVGEAVTVAKGFIVATGHTCWGICNAPGTGRIIAELILEGKVSCTNTSKLQPGLFL